MKMKELTIFCFRSQHPQNITKNRNRKLHLLTMDTSSKREKSTKGIRNKNPSNNFSVHNILYFH